MWLGVEFEKVERERDFMVWRRSIDSLLDEASKALETSKRELEEFKKSRDPMKLRDSAEKAWLAVNKAVEALLTAHRVDAKTYREKRDGLRRLGYDSLAERFMARSQGLHIDCFYDGICDHLFVEDEIAKVEEIIRSIEERIRKILY